MSTFLGLSRPRSYAPGKSVNQFYQAIFMDRSDAATFALPVCTWHVGHSYSRYLSL